MKLRRLIALLLFLGTATAFRGFAQENPYGIDAQCYDYFIMAESLVGDTSNNAFEVANDALLKRAIECSDEKARTIHYVENLKRTIRIARAGTNRLEENQKVEAARQEVMRVSTETGYPQYFFYAYELTQTYYINTSQEGHAQTVLQEMLRVSQERKDEYGLWLGKRFIATLYHNQNDTKNARKYFLEAIRIHDETHDPTIRRQSITRACCDLSETYPVGSDSARLFIRKAREGARIHQDSLRYFYYSSQLAALDGKRELYTHYRDLCISDPAFMNAMRTTPEFFECVEGIMNGSITPDAFDSKLQYMQYVQQLVFLRELALRQQRWDIAAMAGNGVISNLYSAISRMNSMRIDEVSAAHGNFELSMELVRQQKRSRVIVSITLTLVIVLLGGILAFVLWRYRKLRAGHLILKRKHSNKI